MKKAPKPFQIKKGEIFYSDGKTWVAVEDSFYNYRKGGMKLQISALRKIKFDEMVKKGKAPEDMKRMVYTVWYRDVTSITKKGKVTPAQLKIAIGAHDTVVKKSDEFVKKNREQIKLDTKTWKDYVVAKDKTKIYIGDLVDVRFDNGTFTGKVTEMPGGKIMGVKVLFRNKSKATTVTPERIMCKSTKDITIERKPIQRRRRGLFGGLYY
jgi:hypothetical protein